LYKLKFIIASKNYAISKDHGNKTSPRMRFANGYDQCSLSREFVDYLFGEMDPTILMHQLNNGYFGTNEVLFATLHNTDELNAPGGFSHICLDPSKQPYDVRANHITR
jgi:hypothetical protein